MSEGDGPIVVPVDALLPSERLAAELEGVRFGALRCRMCDRSSDDDPGKFNRWSRTCSECERDRCQRCGNRMQPGDRYVPIFIGASVQIFHQRCLVWSGPAEVDRLAIDRREQRERQNEPPGVTSGEPRRPE